MYFSPGAPVDLRAIGDQRWLFDVVYSPIETPLVVRANAAGMAVLNGFELFLGQGFDAFERFTGTTARATRGAGARSRDVAAGRRADERSRGPPS